VHSLQVRAVKHGMHLNEFGLWRWVGSVDADPDAGAEAPPTERRGRRPKTSALALEGLGSMWELVPTDTEQDIFDALGAEWVEPARRGWEFIERAR
jgi:DNA polymerase beta